MRESVPTARYSPVCNVLRQWKTSLILTYRVYRLYDMYLGAQPWSTNQYIFNALARSCFLAKLAHRTTSATPAVVEHGGQFKCHDQTTSIYEGDSQDRLAYLAVGLLIYIKVLKINYIHLPFGLNNEYKPYLRNIGH